MILQSQTSNIIKFHPNKQTDEFTINYSDLFDCEIVYIVSPNDTHVSYIPNHTNTPNTTGNDACSCLSLLLYTFVAVHICWRHSKKIEILKNAYLD